MKFLSLFIAILICSSVSWAQETFEDYEFISKAQTVVIENQQFLNQDLQRKVIKILSDRPELLTNEDPTQMLEELTSQGLPAKTKVKITGALKNVFVGILHEVRTIVRRYGVVTGIAYGAIEITNQLATVIFIAVARPELAAFSAAFPAGTIFLLSTVAVTNLVKRHQTIKLYGGKENYRYYKHIKDDVKKSLHLSGKDSLIMPLEKNAEEEFTAITMSRMNIFNKTYSMLNHKRKKLDVIQLKYFLKDHNAWDTQLENIKSSKASEGLKVASMLHHILTINPTLYKEIETQYEQSFVTIASFEFKQSLKNWSLAAIHVKTKMELLNTADMIPMGVSALDVTKIWAKCIVPHLLEESKGLSFSSYRSFAKSINSVEIKAELTPYKVVDEEWVKAFKLYLSDALN
jgi:hypothetical protein